MKRFLKPSRILFYLQSAILFFFLGIFYAKITGAGKNQMLAGGAIVLGYGVVSGGLAFFVAIVAAQYIKNTTLVFINKIFAVGMIIFWAFFAYRYQTNRPTRDKPASPQPDRPKTAPASLLPALKFNVKTHGKYRPPMGLGMAAPTFNEHSVLYLYANPNLEKPISEHSPTDSIVFKHTERGQEITYAPPWFVPAHLKLDYNVFFIRIVSVYSDFIEVLVNKTNGQSAFIDRHKTKIVYWPDFLLTINSVEQISPKNNPVRVKALSHASLISTKYSFLKPFRISNQWMQVELLDDNFKSHGKGWIKWQENGELLITYSLFS